MRSVKYVIFPVSAGCVNHDNPWKQRVLEEYRQLQVGCGATKVGSKPTAALMHARFWIEVG